MQEELLHQLEQYGLSEKEAKVYMILLELGNCIASTIANKSLINRATIYTILNSLKSRGYINETTKNDIKYYSAISPEILLDDLEKKAQKFKNIVPDLLSLTGKYDNKPKVEYYDGFEGLKRVFEIVLAEGYKMNEPYLSFVGKNTISNKNLLKYLEEEFIPKRKFCPTRTKIIASAKNDEKYLNENIGMNEKVLISEDIFDLGDEIVLYSGNKIAILMYSEKNLGGIIIENQSLFNSFKSIFNLIWKTYA